MQDKSPAITLLRWIGKFLPGDYLKTVFYLYVFAAPRRLIRFYLYSFYRMEHIYDVFREVKSKYKGKFTVLEFGTNEGYSITKMLYATRFLKMEDRITIHGFDSFEGMPAPTGRYDKNIIADDDEWIEGQFKGKYEILNEYLSGKYKNFELHKGFFEDSITPEFLESLKNEKPVLIWIDCDFYSSTKAVLDRILPYLPNGCYIYFDEFEFNYGSRFTGEARAVYEINNGDFGDDGIELIFDAKLSLDSRRIYRFMRYENAVHYDMQHPIALDPGRAPTNGSPLP